MTITTNCRKFKGEIENYLINGQNNFELKIDNAFSSLSFKTWLCRTNIRKQDGYHASHLLFMLIILPLLKIKTVNIFCRKQWLHWSTSKKDTFYRFKHNANFRWRSFMNKVNLHIFKKIGLENIPQEERYFIIDDTIMQKMGSLSFY